MGASDPRDTYTAFPDTESKDPSHLLEIVGETVAPSSAAGVNKFGCQEALCDLLGTGACLFASELGGNAA